MILAWRIGQFLRVFQIVLLGGRCLEAKVLG